MKVFLKRKNKINLCIFCSLSWSCLSLIQGSYFNKKLRESKFQFWWLRNKIRCWQFLTDFVNFDNIYPEILKKKFFFLLGIIASVNRRGKDIKVTFVSLDHHAGRFTVECNKYGNTLFSYFDIFRYVSSNFTLDSRLWVYRLAASHLLY